MPNYSSESENINNLTIKPISIMRGMNEETLSKHLLKGTKTFA